MAAHLNGLSFVDHALELFFSNTRNGSGYPGLMAVTVEPGRQTVQDLQAHIPQKIFQDLLRCLSSIQKSGDGAHLSQTGLQPVDAVIRSSRHQLDNEASAAKLFEKFGFTVENVVNTVKAL